jgi:hypothetical protein
VVNNIFRDTLCLCSIVKLKQKVCIRQEDATRHDVKEDNVRGFDEHASSIEENKRCDSNAEDLQKQERSDSRNFVILGEQRLLICNISIMKVYSLLEEGGEVQLHQVATNMLFSIS